MVWVFPEFQMGSQVYWLFEAAVQAVGNRELLDPSWLNVTGGDFVREAGPLPKMKLWKKFSPLYVYLPPKDFINVYCDDDVYANSGSGLKNFSNIYGKGSRLLARRY